MTKRIFVLLILILLISMPCYAISIIDGISESGFTSNTITSQNEIIPTTGDTVIITDGSNGDALSKADVSYFIGGGSGSVSVYNDIGDPTANSSISFTGYTNTWVTNEIGSDFFTIKNSGNFGDMALMKLEASGANPTAGAILEIVNTDADVISIVAPNFSLGADGVGTFSGSKNPGVKFGGETSDPCPTEGAGFSFFNGTDGKPCYCANSGDDLRVSDDTVCFP